MLIRLHFMTAIDVLKQISYNVNLACDYEKFAYFDLRVGEKARTDEFIKIVISVLKKMTENIIKRFQNYF